MLLTRDSILLCIYYTQMYSNVVSNLKIVRRTNVNPQRLTFKTEILSKGGETRMLVALLLMAGKLILNAAAALLLLCAATGRSHNPSSHSGERKP